MADAETEGLIEELGDALKLYKTQLQQLDQVASPSADTLQLRSQLHEAILLTQTALTEALGSTGRDGADEVQPPVTKAQHQHTHKRAASVSLDARDQEHEEPSSGGIDSPIAGPGHRAGQPDQHLGVVDQVQAIQQLSIDHPAPASLPGQHTRSLPSSEHGFRMLGPQAPAPAPLHGLQQPGFLHIPSTAGQDQDGDMDSEAGYIPPPSLSDTDSQLFSDSPHSVSKGPHSFNANSMPPSPAFSEPASARRAAQQAFGGNMRASAGAPPFTNANQPDNLPGTSPLTNAVLSSSPYLFPDDRLEEMDGNGQEEVQGSLDDNDTAKSRKWGAAGSGSGSGRPGGTGGGWSAWWNANKARPAAAYGGSISAWLSGVTPGAQRQPSDDIASIRSTRSSTDGSCVQQVVHPHRITSRAVSRSSSWSFDSAEQLAIAAAEAAADAAGDGGDMLTGDWDAPPPGVGATAAAARAAARRAKAAAAQHAEQQQQQQQQGATAGSGVACGSPAGGGQHGSGVAVHGPPGRATAVAVGGGGAAGGAAGQQQQHLQSRPSQSNNMDMSSVDVGEVGSDQPEGLEVKGGGQQQGELQSAWVPEAPRPGRQGRNNPRMHVNNRYYLQEPDFIALSTQYPELKQYLTLPSHPGGRAVYDFTSWEATRQLTATLLQADFGVRWWLPEGQLVPTITNRCNYLHWVQDLLSLSRPPGQMIRGLDVGCGANLIYCLLGAAGFDWHMVGVDVTDVAVTWALHNMESNPHLSHLLEVRRSASKVPHDASSNNNEAADLEDDDPGGVLIPAFKSDTETFTFTVCNPPFFNNIQEANTNPATACGGTSAEMVYPGGELAFIMRMIEDSVRLGSRVHWYSTMVGKKVTLKALRKELHMRHVTAIRTTELAQGKTSRWAIAWSFDVDRNLANVPLPRHVAQAAATAGVPSAKKSISFSLKAGRVDARGVLQLLSSLLTAQGATCSIDAAQWRVTAVLPPPTSGLTGNGADVAEAALLAEISRDQHQAASSASTMMQAAKKARGSPLVLPPPHRTVSDALASSAAQALSIRINVFQQQRGQFELTASIPNASSQDEAVRFTQLLNKVHGDLEAISS